MQGHDKFSEVGKQFGRANLKSLSLLPPPSISNRPQQFSINEHGSNRNQFRSLNITVPEVRPRHFSCPHPTSRINFFLENHHSPSKSILG